MLTTDATPDMATQTIDIAVRDDLSAQAECGYRILLEDRLYPACHPDLLAQPEDARCTLHGEREMDWSHWEVQGGVDVGQRSQGLNFSDPGLLLDAASEGLGIALVSRLLATRASEQGLLVPLVEQRVRGPNWSWLVHRDSQNDPLTCSFCDWLVEALGMSQSRLDGYQGN
ncbi:putative choline sulfate-utilization transcription factor [compost metagenome]